MNLINGVMYKVKSDHPHHPNRLGYFQFIGGPERDVIVLSEIANEQSLFAVGLKDLTDFNPETDEIIILDFNLPGACSYTKPKE